MVVHYLVVEEVFGLAGSVDLAGYRELGSWDHCIEVCIVLLVEDLLEGDSDGGILAVGVLG